MRYIASYRPRSTRWMAKIYFIGYFAPIAAVWDIYACTRSWNPLIVLLVSVPNILLIMAFSQWATDHDKGLKEHPEYIVNCLFSPTSFLAYFTAALIPVIFVTKNTVIGTHMEENRFIILWLQLLIAALIVIGFYYQKPQIFWRKQ